MAKENNGTVTTAMVVAAGFSHGNIKYLVDKGVIEKSAIGVYILPEVWGDEILNLQNQFKRGIYAALSGRRFYEGLKEVERYNISRIIIMIQEQEKRNKKRVILDSEYEELKSIYLRRNFWTHSCYTNMVFDRKTGGPKKETDIRQLYQDTREAEQMRDLLFEKKIKLMEIIRDNHTF